MGFDRRAHPRAAGTDDQDVVLRLHCDGRYRNDSSECAASDCLDAGEAPWGFSDNSVRSRWEGQLLAGAARTRFEGERLGSISWVSHPDGGSTVAQARALALDPPTDRDGVVLRALVEATAREELEELEILRPYGFAAAMTLRVPDAHSFIRLVLKQFLERSSRYSGLWDGSLVEVRDGEDDPAWISAYTARTTAGAGWVRPDVECCDDATFARSRSIAWEGPPPCPVFDRTA